MLIAVEADNTEDVEVIFRKVRNKLRNCLHRSRRKKATLPTLTIESLIPLNPNIQALLELVKNAVF